MTRGTLSTDVSPRSYPDRASGRPMVLTLRRSCSNEVSGQPRCEKNAVVVWARPLYIQEAQKQLSDRRFYDKLSADPLQTCQRKVKFTINDMIARCALPPSAKNVVLNTPHTSRFYLLQKIHKPNNPGRPIVSACSCPTENISAYLDEGLAPFVKSLPTNVKGTSHALHIFDSCRFDTATPGHHFLFIHGRQVTLPSDPT